MELIFIARKYNKELLTEVLKQIARVHSWFFALSAVRLWASHLNVDINFGYLICEVMGMIMSSFQGDKKLDDNKPKLNWKLHNSYKIVLKGNTKNTDS